MKCSTKSQIRLWTFVSPSRWMSTPCIPRHSKKSNGFTSQSVRESFRPSLPRPPAGFVRAAPLPPPQGVPTPVPDSRPPKIGGERRVIAEVDRERGQRFDRSASRKSWLRSHLLALCPKTATTGDVVDRRWAPPFGSASSASSGKEKKKTKKDKDDMYV